MMHLSFTKQLLQPAACWLVSPLRMRQISLLLLLAVATLFVGGCTSGKKALEQGNYYDAVLKAVNRLRSKPDQKKAMATLQDGYPRAVQWQLDRANQVRTSNAPFKWEQAVAAYQKLNRLYEEINRSPGALKVINSPQSFYQQETQAKEQAAAARYDAGVASLQGGTRALAKEAFFNFKKADGFVAGYRDVYDKMDEARYLATLKVVVEQIPLPSRTYELSAGFFQDQVEAYLIGNQRNEFVRFYTPQEAQREQLNTPDHFIRIQFDDFVVGNTHTTERIESITSDSIKVGEVTLEDGTVQPIIGTVKAKVRTFHKEVISTGILSYEIYEARSNNILARDRLSGQFVWFCEWGNFNGDERALTDELLGICNSSPLPPPPPQDLFIEFTKPIYSQLTSGLDRFYRRY